MGIGMLPVGKVVRLAIVTMVGPNYIECEFYDKFGEKPFKCPIPHPYAGRGGGIFVGMERNTIVLVANGPQEQWFIVATIPDANYFFDLEGVTDMIVGETSYPQLEEGEICIKGNQGQKMELLNNGNISFDANIGNKSYDFELSNLAQGMFVRVNNVYQFTEAGRSIEGLVKRDINKTEDLQETTTTDFLSGETYEKMLTTIGRSPTDEAHSRTTTNMKSIVRNPALVEKRDIVYEFGDSFGVRGYEFERDAMKQIAQIKKDGKTEIVDPIKYVKRDPSYRENRRTDILDLNLRNYNHLIERVQGTLVDIYGNILDINRNKIEVPEVEEIVAQTDRNNDMAGLKKAYDYLRRSVKYHFEINSRKDITDNEPIKPGTVTIDPNNLKDHSRFSIDVDAEGLTKINIPASSETGNIPILNRHIVSRETVDGGSNKDNGAFKDSEGIDIRSCQFGAGNDNDDGNFSGQTIVDSSYRPKSINNLTITVGTAFHDMMSVASSIFENGKLRIPQKSETKVQQLTEEINNQISDSAIPNAGGRSMHLNLDGSLEASIGADTADRKSMLLDLAGGVVSHFGRDINGRSVMHQSDGDVIIQVGGKGVYDSRFDNDIGENRSGRVEIHFNRVDGDPSKIIIDEDGITIKSEGSLLLKSKGDCIIASDSNLLLHGKLIKQYGGYDEDTRSITGAEKVVGRNGRKSG